MADAKRRTFTRRSARIAPLLAWVAGAAGASLLVAGPSRAGNAVTLPVKGRIVGWEKLIPQVYADASKADSRRYTWREASPTVKADFRKLSANVSRDVCVAAFASGNGGPHDGKIVNVTGGRITPSTIVVSPGSRLVFKNLDPFPHALYEEGNASWAANPTGPGSQRDWAGTSPGVHEIRDQLFPSVVMHIVVDPNATEFAFPDHDGNFTMAVPAGDYTIRVFFDGKPIGKPLDGVHVTDKGFELKDPISVGGDSK